MAKALDSSGIAPHLGADRIFHETGVVWSATLAAVHHAYEVVQNDVCPGCPQQGQSLDNKQDWYYKI
jgi:hypothetical protein